MMNNFCLIFPVLIYMFASLVFASNRKHFLMTLLSLEFIVLCLFFMLFILFESVNSDMYILMVYLVFSVCEGALGLSILVSLIRTHGNNYLQSFNLLTC